MALGDAFTRAGRVKNMKESFGDFRQSDNAQSGKITNDKGTLKTRGPKDSKDAPPSTKEDWLKNYNRNFPPSRSQPEIWSAYCEKYGLDPETGEEIESDERVKDIKGPASVDDVIDEIISDLAAGLIDASDDEILKKLSSYDLEEEDLLDILDLIDDVRSAESEADGDISVSKSDTNGDGDVDKITVKKREESGDKPHDKDAQSDATMRNIIDTLSQLRMW